MEVVSIFTNGSNKEGMFMLKNKLRVLWVLIGFALIVPQMPVFAGEHPGVKASGETEAKVKQAAQDYINAQVKDKGSFEVDDKVAGKTRKLKFDYFHTINKLDNGDYFFCADFTEGKDRLDLDFTVSGDDLKVKKVVIHKVNGVAR